MRANFEDGRLCAVEKNERKRRTFFLFVDMLIIVNLAAAVE